MELDERLKAQPDTEEEFFGRVFQAQVQSLHQMRDPPATFKGREEDLDELAKAIRKGGVTISGVRGMGGIGKTALALKLAQRLAPEYPDAQIFVDLQGTTSPLAPGDVMGHVIHTFHPRAELPATESERCGLYRSVLRGKEALLLFDDAAGAGQVQPLVPPGSCALLVTSRRRFRLPGMHTLDLNVLDEDESRELLCAIAPRISDECAVEIAELCGRLPLALELAASALAERRDLAPAEYARRLRDERRRLDLVDAPLSLSYDLFSKQLQQLWARLSVFAIPFDSEAAAAVWEMEGEHALDPLGELLRYSLIDWRETTGRYELHALARLFAYRKLEEMEDVRPVHRLAAEHLEGKLKEEGGTPGEALQEVDQWEKAEAWERFARSASALVGSLDRLGYWEEIEERLERTLEAVESRLDEPKLQATLLGDLGVIAQKRAEWEHAIDAHRQSLNLFEQLGDVTSMAGTYLNLGIVYRRQGNWDLAIDMYEQALEVFRQLSDVGGVAKTANNLGLAYVGRGEWSEAIAHFHQSLQLKVRLNDLHGMAQTWGNLGIVFRRLGD